MAFIGFQGVLGGFRIVFGKFMGLLVGFGGVLKCYKAFQLV